MKPWFIKEDNVVPFPKKDKGVVRLPNINAYPDFLTGVQDLQNHLKQGDISSDIHKKLYQDLIHRFMKTESFETPWFLREAEPFTDTTGGIMDLPQAIAGKLDFIKSKLSQDEITDPKTIDFIYKILNKEQIKGTIDTLVSNISSKDQDIQKFRQLNQGVFSKVIRKLPVQKEELDKFLSKWAEGNSFVDTSKIKIGARGTLQDLIPDPTAFKCFEIFEQIKSTYRMPKKGTTGYGEFGMAMLSVNIRLKAPGDIEINGSPVEVKGNDARLYADERTMTQPQESIQEAARGTGMYPANVHKLLISQNTAERKQAVESVANSFRARGISDADIKKLMVTVQKDSPDAVKALEIAWWKAGFNYYQRAIKMPIMVIGFGQWMISDKADDFINWGCTPKTPSNYGYMFGRQAGQSRETFPKIFIPGHNK